MRGEELQSWLDRLLAEWESQLFPSPLVGRVPPRGGMRLGLGAPKGQPHASPGQRPGFLRPDSTSPEGAIPPHGLRTPRFGTPFQGLDGSSAGHPGALPRAGVCRAVGAPGSCKACGHGFSRISCISWFHNPQGANRWHAGWGGPSNHKPLCSSLLEAPPLAGTMQLGRSCLLDLLSQELRPSLVTGLALARASLTPRLAKESAAQSLPSQLRRSGLAGTIRVPRT